jgi:pentalenene oxygenase
MLECTQAVTGSWVPGREIDLNAALHALAVAISAKALANTSVATELAVEVEGLVNIMAAGVGRRVVDPTGLLEKLPIPSNWRFERARARLRAVFDELIQDYRQNNINGSDVLSILLAARDENTGDGMSDGQLRDEVISILLAGLETSAQALKWIFYALSEHPDTQRRVREEIDRVVTGHTLAFEDLDRLTYTRWVINEVLRLYPPLYFLSRRPTVDVEIAGYRIPAGSTVLFSPYALHRDPGLYPEPDRFDPERWRPGGCAELPRISYVPFGAGIRSCIGEQFALTEMLTVVGCVMRDWAARRTPATTVRPKPTFVLSPSASGVVLEPRHTGR